MSGCMLKPIKPTTCRESEEENMKQFWSLKIYIKPAGKKEKGKKKEGEK